MEEPKKEKPPKSLARSQRFRTKSHRGMILSGTEEEFPMITKSSSFYWMVAVVPLFGFSLLAQESKSSVKPAESPSQPELITNITLESLQRIIQGMGFDCT